MFSPFFPPLNQYTPMSSVRSCKASCHSDAFSQALSREFMVIKVGCRRLLWISSSKCKFRGQASSWKPWSGSVASIAWPKVCPSFIRAHSCSGSQWEPINYDIYYDQNPTESTQKNGCITVWHHCWVVIYSKNGSCKSLQYYLHTVHTHCGICSFERSDEETEPHQFLNEWPEMNQRTKYKCQNWS